MSDLRKALKPFAKAADLMDQAQGRTVVLLSGQSDGRFGELKIAHFRRAREAFSGGGEIVRCDYCDNGIEPEWEFCAWCSRVLKDETGKRHPRPSQAIQAFSGGGETPNPRAELIEALKSYRQADQDGVMVLVSRQACEEAAALLQDIADHLLFNKSIPPGMLRPSTGDGERVREECAKILEAEAKRLRGKRSYSDTDDGWHRDNHAMAKGMEMGASLLRAIPTPKEDI
jgi:hypothetical protein